MSDFLDANGVPLRLRVRISYPASRLGLEQTIDEYTLTDIRKGVQIVRRQGARSASVRYQGPIMLSLAKHTSDANYSLLKGLLVTFRFRRLSGGGTT